ncbi:MAG TPA: c-type cytochrome [Chryseolinea sp.]|nr:c-type cytochrome [Chryseolinea sp.]
MTQSRNIFIVIICVLSFGFTYWQNQNSPPKVTISVQGKGNTFQWSSVVPYTIAVSDAEDGNTEYGEIPPHEVLLVAQYLPDSTLVKKTPSDEQIKHFDALVTISKALCFNCHAARAKLIGPSFEQIAARYKSDPATVDLLTKKIIDGSTGTWSDLKMPPHPDLEVQEIKEMVTWILENNADPDLTYFVGTNGALRTREKPANTSEIGIYVLTARYMDHGPRNTNDGLRTPGEWGHHTLVLRSLE